MTAIRNREPIASDIIVLGAGIAGLSAAQRLRAAGHNVVVIESEHRCGGTHRSRSIGPYTFDVGSIFYEPGAPILDLAPGLIELCPTVWRRQRRISPSGAIQHYPIEPREVLYASPFKSVLGLADMLASRALVRTDGSLDAIIRRRLGRTFYQLTGLENYVSRFHHVPPAEIDESFFFHRMGFIDQMTRAGTVLRKGFGSVLSKKRINSANRRPQMVRPYEGFDRLFAPIRQHLEHAGIDFRFGETPQLVTRGEHGFTVVTDKATYHGDSVVSTIPLEALHRMLFGEPTGLVSLDMTTLFVSAESFSPQAGNALFNFHPLGWWKRATIYSRIYPDAPTDREFMGVEVTIGEGKAHVPERAFDDFSRHMQQLGLGTGFALEGAEYLPHCYPLYRTGSTAHLQKVLARLGATGVIMAGRQGRFEYLPTASKVIRRVGEELANAGLTSR